MQQSTIIDSVLTSNSSSQEARDVLTEILRHGARQMLAVAIDNEVEEYLTAYHHQLDEHGHRLARSSLAKGGQDSSTVSATYQNH